MRAVFLVLHVASGAVALALGPLALLVARRRRHSAAGLRDAYHWVVLVVCVTAAVVSVLAWTRLWWLVPIGALSYGLALAGYLGSRQHWPLWLRAHAWGGSYIGWTLLFANPILGCATVLWAFAMRHAVTLEEVALAARFGDAWPE